MVITMAIEVLTRYLAVLSTESLRHGPATLATLQTLHRAHVLHFAHDTVWMSRQRLAPFGYLAMAAALVRGEGGACFQLNASFAWLLRSLGFEVTMHRSRVQNAFDAAPDTPIDAHVVLQVRTPEGLYLADVGLGAGLLDPMALTPGTTEQGGYRYDLAPAEVPGLAWSLGVDRKLLGVRRTEWEREPVLLADLEQAHLRDATGADSPFLRHLTAHVRTATGSAILNGRTLTTVHERRRTLRTLESAAEWEHVLRTVFHLSLPHWSPEERDRLWEKAGGEVGREDTFAAC